MRIIHTNKAHKKYSPHQSKWKAFCNWRKKRRNRKNFKLSADISIINNYKKNPFKKERKKIRYLGHIKLVLLFVLIITWLIAMLYLPYFKIDTIEVSGLVNISRQNVTDHVRINHLKNSKILPLKNYFFINTTQIEKDLLATFPAKDIKVIKKFPNVLDIEIVEKRTSLIYDNLTSYYYLDDTGTIVKKLEDIGTEEYIYIITTSTPELSATSTTSTIKKHIPDYKSKKNEYGPYPILLDRRAREITLDDYQIVPDNYITTITKFDQLFIEKKLGIVKYYEISNIGGGIKVITNNIWDVYLSVGESANDQIDRLIKVKDQYPLQLYIDLRYKDKIFWK